MKQGEHVRKFSKNYYNALNDAKKNYQKISDDVNNNSVDPVEIKKQAEITKPKQLRSKSEDAVVAEVMEEMTG